MYNLSTTNQKHRQFRLHLAAVLSWMAIVGLIVFVGMVWWLYQRDGKVTLPLLMFGIGGLVTAHLGGLLCSHGLKCNVCGQPVFSVEPANRPDHRARKFMGFSYRLQVAREILTKEHYHCIHCHSICRSRRTISARGEQLEPVGVMQPEATTEENLSWLNFKSTKPRGLTELGLWRGSKTYLKTPATPSPRWQFPITVFSQNVTLGRS